MNTEVAADPRNVFLTPVEVMARYRWGRTKGYEVMRTHRDGFPRCVFGRYRLDTLLQWEDQQLGSSSAAESSPAHLLPERKRPGRKRAS